MTPERHDALKDILNGRLRDVQADDMADMRELLVGVTDDMDQVLMEMRGEALGRITNAFAELAEGDYGNCEKCGDEIDEKQLRALPFKTICKDCEEAKERAAAAARQVRPNRRDELPLS